MLGSGLITRGLGGLQFSNDGTKTTILGIAGDYIRFGDAGLTAHTLNSEDDVMVTGELEVKGAGYFDNAVIMVSNQDFKLGAAYYKETTADADAISLFFGARIGSGGVPAFIHGNRDHRLTDIGLFESITQPTIAALEKGGRVVTIANCTSTGADDTITTATSGGFTDVAVNDIVRVTAGTNATAGFYVVTVVTDTENIDVDRNWCSGAVSGGTMVIYHHVGCMSGEGLNFKIKTGADFAAGDFELSGLGAWAGWREDTQELQIVHPNGTMYKIALA